MHDVKSGRAEMKNSRYVSMSGSAKAFFKRANLAATCFFGSSIPVSSLLLTFVQLWSMEFNPSYFSYSFLQQTSRVSHRFEINRMISSHSSLTNPTCSLSSRTSFEVVVNIYLLFFHIKSKNIYERFFHLTCSKMNKVIGTPRK